MGDSREYRFLPPGGRGLIYMMLACCLCGGGRYGFVGYPGRLCLGL